jgi:AcrR family transcriptional regulator
VRHSWYSISEVSTPNTPRRPGRRQRAADPARDAAVRARIVELAHARFRAAGIRRVAIGDLAADLRMSKRTFYRHFPDKESLVAACVGAIDAAMHPLVMAAWQVGDPRPRFAALCRALLHLPAQVSAEFLVDVQADHPAVFQGMDQRRRALFAAVEATLADGLARGQVRRGVCPRAVPGMILAFALGAHRRETTGNEGYTMAEAESTLLALADGLFLPSGAEPQDKGNGG